MSKFLISLSRFCQFAGFSLLSVMAIAPIALATASSERSQRTKTPLTLLKQETEKKTEETADNSSEEESEEESEEASFADLVADTTRIEGLFPLYHNSENGDLLLELRPEDLDRLHLLIMTLSQGTGVVFLEGLPLQDIPILFQKRNDRILITVPNTYFRAETNDPQNVSLGRSFSDSVLASLEIKATHPERGSYLIDLGNLLLTEDLQNLNSLMTRFSFTLQDDRSYISDIKNFPENTEIEAQLGFSGGDSFFLSSTLPDARALTLGVRYSLSRLPETSNYRPRRADNRIGYFITAYQNLSDFSQRDPFVRYIQRWNLEKQDPNAALSPPVEPIVFWIENTVPHAYRQTIREGVLMWNQAFEQAGYLNAIEVRQMPADADWDPADVRYNTIRWSQSFNSGFAGIGPSRVNPLTGEILDADILINANIVRLLMRETESLLGSASSGMERERLLVDLPGGCVEDSCTTAENEAENEGTRLLQELRSRSNFPFNSGPRLSCNCAACTQAFQEGALALSLLRDVPPGDAMMEAYIQDYLRFLVAHEVGHTLGLRHNFQGSTLRRTDELQDVSLTRREGLTGSVMDYLPANIAPRGEPQGEFFPTRLGPYDEWAITYGYESFQHLPPQEEQRRLQAIARRSTEPELRYGTDEDLWSEIDPAINWFDLGADMLVHAESQMQLGRQMLERLEQRFPREGEPPDTLRSQFNFILFYYFRQSRVLLKHIGGQSFNRHQSAEVLPFEPLPLEEQERSLALISEYIFAEDAFDFSPTLLNRLVPSRWFHWGSSPSFSRVDYPIHDQILGLQGMVLRSLLSPERLRRLRDLELKTPPGEALEVPDLLDRVYREIWSEVLQGRRMATNVSSLRRGLQRQHLQLSLAMATGRTRGTEDARTLASYYLRELEEALTAALRRQDDLDTYTRAHLQDSRMQIREAMGDD
ncbi:MAG: zinc-dependent metalloprotease [Phormidium sp.]